ncbi:MAG: hypothetical protein R3233_08955, partial [Xanthomonadales bacterium]|nr:hypothetical protein [Xanthomonadales bacterium]
MHYNRPQKIADSPLAALEDHGAFVRRHIGPREDDIEAMLAAVGADSLDTLVTGTLPPNIRDDEPLDL